MLLCLTSAESVIQLKCLYMLQRTALPGVWVKVTMEK